jgi:dephospho-CoA kinase
MVIGLLGGIGSGKSAVARLFAEAGASVVDADRMAREEIETPEARERVSALFGGAVLSPDGSVDRRALADRAFADRASLQRLNDVVHPPVRRRVREAVRRHRAAERSARGAARVLVLDVPLLAESPLRSECDALVFIETADAVRRARLAERGWPAGELERRESFQTPVIEKRKMARWVVDNTGSLEATRKEVGRLLNEIERDTRTNTET